MNARIKDKINQARLSHSKYACKSCDKKTMECINKAVPKYTDGYYVRKCFNQSCNLYGQIQFNSDRPSNSQYILPKELREHAVTNELDRQLKYGPNKTKSIAHVTNEEKQRIYNEIAELFNV